MGPTCRCLDLGRPAFRTVGEETDFVQALPPARGPVSRPPEQTPTRLCHMERSESLWRTASASRCSLAIARKMRSDSTVATWRGSVHGGVPPARHPGDPIPVPW